MRSAGRSIPCISLDTVAVRIENLHADRTALLPLRFRYGIGLKGFAQIQHSLHRPCLKTEMRRSGQRRHRYVAFAQCKQTAICRTNDKKVEIIMHPVRQAEEAAIKGSRSLPVGDGKGDMIETEHASNYAAHDFNANGASGPDAPWQSLAVFRPAHHSSTQHLHRRSGHLCGWQVQPTSIVIGAINLSADLVDEGIGLASRAEIKHDLTGVPRGP
jgi:hypothetical protein